MQKPLQRRFVKAELFFQLGDEFGRQAARADIIFALSGINRIIRASGDGFKHVALAFKIGQNLLDRSAGDKLYHGEVNDEDPQQRGDHQ